jgi:hypothetical protein
MVAGPRNNEVISFQRFLYTPQRSELIILNLKIKKIKNRRASVFRPLLKIRAKQPIDKPAIVSVRHRTPSEQNGTRHPSAGPQATHEKKPTRFRAEISNAFARRTPFVWG